MKLFVVAAFIAVASAGRLEHLERSYLPPDSSNSLSGGFNARSGSQNGFGQFGAQGSHGFNQGSGLNSFGAHGSSNGGFDNQGSNGFGAQGHGSNGFNSNGFGANGHASNGALNAADLKQYLPPVEHASDSSLGFSGSSIKPACSTCGFARQQYSSQSQFNSQIPSTQYGQPQFGAIPLSQHTNGFGSQSSFNQGSASRQYLAPKAQEIPQQPFDEQTGYHY